MSALEQLPGRIDRLESRINRLESELRAEIRAGDQTLREEMRSGHVMIVTVVTEQIEESRRYARLLHEDVLDRVRIIAEGLAVQTEQIASQTEQIASQIGQIASQGAQIASQTAQIAGHDGKITTLSTKIDAARDESRLMFEQVLARLDATKAAPKRKRR